MKKKTVQSNDPWTPAQPYILKGLEQTGKVFDANQPQLDKYAAESFGTYGRMAPGAEAGITAAQGFTNDTLGGKYFGTAPGGDLYKRTMSGDFIDSNPYLEGMIGKTNRGVTDNVNSQFSLSGRYGSGAHTGVLADRLSEAENALRYQNYGAERDRQMQAAGLLDQQYNTDIGNMQDATGAAQNLMAGSQGLLNQTAELPWIGVGALNGNVRQASSGYGKTTTKSSGGLGQGLMGLAGAGLSGWAGGGFK